VTSFLLRRSRGLSIVQMRWTCAIGLWLGTLALASTADFDIALDNWAGWILESWRFVAIAALGYSGFRVSEIKFDFSKFTARGQEQRFLSLLEDVQSSSAVVPESSFWFHTEQ
jgi:hypothetical protein